MTNVFIFLGYDSGKQKIMLVFCLDLFSQGQESRSNYAMMIFNFRKIYAKPFGEFSELFPILTKFKLYISRNGKSILENMDLFHCTHVSLWFNAAIIQVRCGFGSQNEWTCCPWCLDLTLTFSYLHYIVFQVIIGRNMCAWCGSLRTDVYLQSYKLSTLLELNVPAQLKTGFCFVWKVAEGNGMFSITILFDVFLIHVALESGTPTGKRKKE